MYLLGMLSALWALYRPPGQFLFVLYLVHFSTSRTDKLPKIPVESVHVIMLAFQPINVRSQDRYVVSALSVLLDYSVRLGWFLRQYLVIKTHFEDYPRYGVEHGPTYRR